MIKLIIFDLDGTLYDPDLYFESAFKSISKFLADNFIDDNPEKIEKKLWDIKREKGSMYKKLFDDVLSFYEIKNKKLIAELVSLFHSAPLNNLEPYEDAQIVIKKLGKNYDLALITHGNSDKQIAKLKKLRLFRYFNFVLSAKDEKLSKLDIELYKKVLKKGYAPDEIIYVGDNPLTDFIACKKIGIKTARILRGEFARIKVSKRYDSEFKIKNFYELEKIIKKSDR